MENSSECIISVMTMETKTLNYTGLAYLCIPGIVFLAQSISVLLLFLTFISEEMFLTDITYLCHVFSYILA